MNKIILGWGLVTIAPEELIIVPPVYLLEEELIIVPPVYLLEKCWPVEMGKKGCRSSFRCWSSGTDGSRMA